MHPTLSWPNRMNSLQEILQKKPSIIILSGAGISVSAGIPTFRGSAQKKIGSFSAKQLMSANTLKSKDGESQMLKYSAFLYHQSKSLLPTLFHQFVLQLHQQGLLQRYITQNIDCIDLQLKIPPQKCILVHGQCQTMHCALNSTHRLQIDENILMDLNRGMRPVCSMCGSENQAISIPETKRTKWSPRIAEQSRQFSRIGVLDFGYLLYDRETPGIF